MKKKKITAAAIEKEIIAHQLRLTHARKTIARVIENSPDHPSVEDIYQRVREINKNISMATVYRTLNLLHKIGVLIRHDFPAEPQSEGKGKSRFEPTVGAHEHYHLIDIKTGKIIEFESPALDKIQKSIAKKYGYQIHSQKIELYGVPQKNKKGARDE